MPNRNAHGSPALIYRIDSRSPDEIFEEGFQPWGSNVNFFQHILGYSLGYDVAEEGRSGIISASDSIDSVLRFFGGMLTAPGEPMEYYLYEIRADENVYSAQRTASFYNQRINTGLMEFEEETDLETAIDAVDSVLREFSYQREWFNVGPIPRDRIRGAWRVDSVPINPLHIRHQPDTVHFTPRINEPEQLNPHYVSRQTFANDLPYMEGATPETVSTVNIPNQLVESDVSGGVGASLGFACSPESNPHHPPGRDLKSWSRKGPNLKCYFANKVKTYINLKQHSIKPDRSRTYVSKIYLRGTKTRQAFLLSWENVKGSNNAAIIPPSEITKAPDFIYDVFNCFTWKPRQKEYALALSIVFKDLQTEYDIGYSIAASNDESQKWRLHFLSTDDETTWFYIESIKVPGFSLQREIRTNKLVLRSRYVIRDGYEEMCLSVGQDTCPEYIILPQSPRTNLVDLQLSWFYDRQNYVPVPESGWSKASKPISNTFFYDLNSYKILYIQKSGKISALYNDRDYSQQWNWIRWIPNSLTKTNDIRLKWYFQNEKWIAEDDVNYRNIRNFGTNDYLRVVVEGARWGAFYTTTLSSDIKSIALFRINSEADI